VLEPAADPRRVLHQGPAAHRGLLAAVMEDEAAFERKRSRPGRRSAVAILVEPVATLLAAAESAAKDPASVASAAKDPASVASAAKEPVSALSAVRIRVSAGSAECWGTLPDERLQALPYERPLCPRAWSPVVPRGGPCSDRW
jgi:hypothetical protein